jgi:predicted glycogen debranching enzyme
VAQIETPVINWRLHALILLSPGLAILQTLLPKIYTAIVAFTALSCQCYTRKTGISALENPVPIMNPAPGDRCVRFVGDRVRFTLRDRNGARPVKGWRALLRTNLGRAQQLRSEILEAHTQGLPLAGSSWRDLPMTQTDEGWLLEMPLVEVGYFKAKAYLVDSRGWQHWPEGPDVGISTHPDCYRTTNILYCAFPRMFGAGRNASATKADSLEKTIQSLDETGYAVIPSSGKLRDLIQALPHITQRLGCRIVHLLPVNPTPTTYARFGRYGSPYAALDLTAIDPALVVFDKRTTGVDQFRELTYATHLSGGRVFLDIVINHTGWGSTLQENRPEWFLRESDGRFVSPGAWGVTWEDLVELQHAHVELWDQLAEMLLTWCRRGVDGFRCDAGYKVPVPAWQYIVARVQQEYPHTLFLLEGLGGAWDATEALLTEGGMQWAYSELFQNYSGPQVAGYLEHSFKQSQRVGVLVHYSETHDNERLAARGPGWALLRNRLCALTSVSGGFGFTCGVEWLATEKIKVHGRTAMAWDNPKNLLPELSQLNRLLATHPCFFDGAQLTRLSSPTSEVYALRRESQEGADVVLVLANTDAERPNVFEIDGAQVLSTSIQSSKATQSTKLPPLEEWLDLLGQTTPVTKRQSEGAYQWALAPGAVYCLAPTPAPRGLSGNDYRRARAQAAWGLTALSRIVPAEQVGELDWKALSAAVERSPARFLANISRLKLEPGKPDLLEAINQSDQAGLFCPVITWTLLDRRRVTPVPPEHWLLIQDTVPFRATLSINGIQPSSHVESIPIRDQHFACFTPQEREADALLRLERYGEADQHVEANIRFLKPWPEQSAREHAKSSGSSMTGGLKPTNMLLLTNGRGGMARMCVDLGRILSKYDCVLGANLHPTLPVDRHVFAKRIRVWVNASGFISPLDFRTITNFEPGPPAAWYFRPNAGDGRTVEIQMTVGMLEGKNTVVFTFSRPLSSEASGKQLPPDADVRLTLRLDIEDRNFHSQTQRNGGAEFHFSSHLRPISPQSGGGATVSKVGFTFAPASDRTLRVFANQGFYHPAPEWSENIHHPVEESRAQVGSGDAFSPGWFELPMPAGNVATLVVCADPADPEPSEIENCRRTFERLARAAPGLDDKFEDSLLKAIRAFVVRRNGGKTVIAGYPWFLDWGRDTFICARGLLAAGMVEDVKQILITFGKFEHKGTLPNTIHGEDASNRDTTDAPLWFGLVCEELAGLDEPIHTIPVNSGRSLFQVVESIATHYVSGTPNGIRMDPDSALIWSPSHFTWMDTNYPAATPREGYPIEIQALWIRLLRHLAALSGDQKGKYWSGLAEKALTSLNAHFWREELGYYADVLLADRGQPAARATVDEVLRSNCLFVISLGLADANRARRCVEVANRFLTVPGALRSLAPLKVSVPLSVRAGDGHLLNNPSEPYWGHYEGDEDTRRKPAYHNGTAWTWTFPGFCESIARAWDFAPEATAAARAYLGSMARLMTEGCLGQIPEILDGDAPHSLRGCDAQAWGVTEALRVWKLLGSRSPRESVGFPGEL